MQQFKVLCLFSGLGALSELGIREAGVSKQFQVTQFVEANPYRRALLVRHYPHIPCDNDVRSFRSTPGQFRIIVGGSPCQGISGANTSGRGLDDERSSLWYEMLRLINQCRPQFVIWENVAAARRTKPGQQCSVLGAVLRGLANSGFDAEWQTISAASCGAPHRRERIFVIAYPNGTFESIGQVPHPWSRQIGADLAQSRHNPPGSSQHPGTQGVDDGTTSWLHGYHRVGWWAAHSPPTTISAPQRSIASRVCRVQALETLAHHSKQQLYGNGSDTWQGSCQAGMRVWSKDTVTHHLESDEPASHETPVLIDEATVTPEVAEELVGVSTDHLNEVGPQTVAQEVRDMVKSVDDTPTPAVEVVEDLSQEEADDRHRLELKVERAFYEAGVALRELRDRKLYRSTHRTFEEYCQGRFGYNRSRSYQMIDAAMIVDNLKKCPQFVDKLPKSESQCRPLTKLTPEQQQQAWTTLLEETGGSIPTGKEVKGIVERLKEKPLSKASNFCQVGDAFTLIRLEGTERKYNGCWAITRSVNEFTLEIDVHDAVLQVMPENLKPIDEPDVRRQLPELLKRIRRLRDCGLLDRCAYTVLESLGQQTYLTEVEEGLLSWLENHYIVD